MPGISDGSFDDLRPLPTRPDLEYERKAAKALHKRLRAGDPEALKRARTRRDDPATYQLADAQLIIARQYGFSSWTRLVQYYETCERHARSRFQIHMGPEDFGGSVRAILNGHRERRPQTAVLLAAFVPRFFGMRPADVLDAPITEDDARLVIAREYGCSSWDVLLEQAAEHKSNVVGRGWEWYDSPLHEAFAAVRAADLAALMTIAAAHPDVLRPTRAQESTGSTIAHMAIGAEYRTRSPEARAISDWLAAQGVNVAETLNTLLCITWTPIEELPFLIERGADPNGRLANGVSVLEHAIFRCWNPEKVDFIAERATPPKSFWVAAGLGDVDSVAQYVSRKGVPSDAARQNRPDFSAMGMGAYPAVLDADDVDVVWEGFYVAMLNRRFAVMDLLLDRGFPIDYSWFGMTPVAFAVGSQLLPLAEYLIRRGANLDGPGYGQTSVRDMARERFQGQPTDIARRILELCGGDPDAVLRAAAERPLPKASLKLQECMTPAAEDAIRTGRAAVEPDNVFVGILRGASFLIQILAASGADMPTLRRILDDRLFPKSEVTGADTIPASEAAREIFEVAHKIATDRRREQVMPHHVLSALIQSDSGPVADLLVAGATTAAKVRDAVEKVL